jgi:hypothetical protein
MDATRFDAIAKVLASRRLSRRAVVASAGLTAGALAAAAVGQNAGAQEAPDATPAPGASEKIPYLFLQAFQSGRVAPAGGEDGRYTLTLEQGLGQTIYFSDRPARDVGATPTPDFLENLGFLPDNPPNAALVVETSEGQTEIAVVELFSPTYDAATHTATYEVAVLAQWERTAQPGEAGFTEAAPDLTAFGSQFSAAHLFIDDCADMSIQCCLTYNQSLVGTCNIWAHNFGPQGFCWNYATCVPCEPYYHTNPYNGAAWDWWKQRCNNEVPACFPDDCAAGAWG